MNRIEPTNTTNWLLPGLNISVERRKSLGFINSYLKDNGQERHYKDSVYCLFKPNDQVLLGNFIAERGDIRDDYDYEGGFTVLVFEFPSKHMVNYYLFLKGEYSKFTQDYKSMFPVKPSREELALYKAKDLPFTKSLANMVLFKSDLFRKYREEELGAEFTLDMELWSKIDMEEETLDISKFNKPEPITIKEINTSNSSEDSKSNETEKINYSYTLSK